MAESCLLSPPTFALLFNKTKPSKRPFLLSLSKPLKLQLSSNNSLTLTARTHRSLFPLFVAHQGDGDTLTLQDQQQQEEGVSETEASLSDWEPNGEEEAAAEGDFVEPSEDAKLFVGNLPYDVDSQKLAMLFEQAGTVEIAEVTDTLFCPFFFFQSQLVHLCVCWNGIDCVCVVVLVVVVVVLGYL